MLIERHETNSPINISVSFSVGFNLIPRHKCTFLTSFFRSAGVSMLTSAADTFEILPWINHCCWMISFASSFELKLLILFTYWNIKSLICHLSWPSFIIVAAACPLGLLRFLSNDLLLNFQHLFLLHACPSISFPTLLNKQLPICALRFALRRLHLPNDPTLPFLSGLDGWAD